MISILKVMHKRLTSHEKTDKILDRQHNTVSTRSDAQLKKLGTGREVKDNG